MRKKMYVALTIVALSFGYHAVSFAEQGHTAEQEQAEQSVHTGSGIQTRQQIEATEEKVLGHDAHQKLEVLHVATESHPLVVIGIIAVIVALITLTRGYFLRRKRR